MQAKKLFMHLTENDRLTMEKLLRNGESIKKIAAILEKHISTIYREKKKGLYEHTSEKGAYLVTEMRYAADKAHRKYRENLKAKGRDLKIKGDEKQIEYINNILTSKDKSPEYVLLKIKREGMKFKSHIKSVNTIYSYIKKGIFPDISMKYSIMPRKKHKKKVTSGQKRAKAGTSIEKRPEEILKREIFGHWEMDSVIGQKTSEKVIISFIERKTRKVILELAKDHSSIEVVRALNRVEKEYGSKFFSVFKSITVDNGSEFSNVEAMEKALYRVGKRTKIYYCHPYCSYERGSNENCHRFIRRFLPKGTSFKELTRSKLKEIQDFINDYLRPMFDGKSSNDMYFKEMENLFSNFS